MKILYHHRIASKDGQYVHVESIVNELKKQGHEIIMVAPSVGENTDFGSDGGWVSKVRGLLPNFISELLEFGYTFYAFLKLCLAIIKHKPDAIYERYNLFLPAGIWAKKIFNIKLVLEVNSPLYDERKEYGGIALPRLAKWTEYYAWRNADKVFPVTHVLANYIKKAGVANDKICVIPNGVDTEVFTRKQPQNRKPTYQNQLVIGFVGFCREWHKLDDVMRILSEHPRKDLTFLVVGDGPIINDLKVLAKSLNFEGRFEATGLVSREEMPYWLDQIDIALQSAVTPWASPLKMIEYMAKGLTIIAPDSANIKELLTHKKNGYLFEDNNQQSFLHGLNDLIDNPEMASRLAESAFESIETNDLRWSKNAERIVAEIKN